MHLQSFIYAQHSAAEEHGTEFMNCQVCDSIIYFNIYLFSLYAILYRWTGAGAPGIICVDLLAV